MLKCNISLDVNHLGEGLRLGLREDREKTSAALGRLALFAGDSRVSRLPPYLVGQMVRFFYKADVQQKAKILRKVSFPLALDMYEFLTDAAKKALDGPREAGERSGPKPGREGLGVLESEEGPHLGLLSDGAWV